MGFNSVFKGLMLWSCRCSPLQCGARWHRTAKKQHLRCWVWLLNILLAASKKNVNPSLGHVDQVVGH